MRMPRLTVIHEYAQVSNLGNDTAASVEELAPDAAPDTPDAPTDPKAPRPPVWRSGYDKEPFANVVDFLCIKGVASAQLLDALSAFLSMIALVLALWRLSVRGIDWFAVPMSMANLVLAPNGTDMGTALEHALNVDLAGVCRSRPGTGVAAVVTRGLFGGWLLPLVSQTPYKQSIAMAKYDDVPYRGTTLAMEAGTWNPMLALVWVFMVSVFFQTWRVILFRSRGNIDKNNKGIVCGFFSEYRPYAGPDFFKWVEYALTSPLQIVIIASTFNIRDRSLLLLLGTLQGALTLLGDSIEIHLRKLVRHRRKSVTGHSRKRSHGLKLVYMLWSAWAVHGVIWFVLLERFQRQTDNLSDCGYKAEMPYFVNFIVFGEFVLFSLFGVVPVVQAVFVFAEVHLSSAPQKKDAARWGAAAQAYAVLSVSAKTLLEFGFLMLLESSPKVRDS